MIREMISKCEFFYDDLLISSEDIIKKYMMFFSSRFNTDQKILSFVFHTGSICFDVASIVAIMLTCFIYNLSSNEDILNSLEIGDMVLFGGERYRWNGIVKGLQGIDPSIEFICIMQDGKGKNGKFTKYLPYQENKHKVKPYYGSSAVTDGRGIRKSKNNRNEFLAHVLNVSEYDVPSALDISVVVIADKEKFVDICQRLKISYGSGKIVQLTDIIPVSYFTGSGEEMQIGKNPSKTEAVIKVVSKVSVARDLILDKTGNKVIGLLAINIRSLTSNASDFKDLIRRKNLRFAIVTSVYNAEFSDLVIEQYEDASIFACTKEMLSTLSLGVKSSNKLTDELNQQIRNIVGRKVDALEVDGGWTWMEYRKIKNNIYTISQSNWTENEKEAFVLSSLALLNLFTFAFFSMEQLEYAIENRLISPAVISPAARLEQLSDISIGSLSVKTNCESVIIGLSEMYEKLYHIAPKGEQLQRLLQDNLGKKIALIVPKAYYVELFQKTFDAIDEYGDVTCCTANRFDSGIQYDLIIVSGDVVGKRFDSLQCYASTQISVLLYECEGKLFKHRMYISAKNERKLNARISGLKSAEYNQEANYYDEDKREDDLNDSIKEFASLDDFVDSIEMFDIRHLMTSRTVAGNCTGKAEVKRVGVFSTGEQILFSKNYRAVVYDRMEQKIIETLSDKLVPGDVLVFTKRNDYTRNIVDLIFDQLMQNERLSKEVKDAAERAYYWKNVLREFKRKEQLTYRDVAKELKKLGSALREVTIRQWLDDESHIVGPCKEETMFLIAELTKDPYLLENPKSYFEACKIVRHYRREILSLIAKAINDKLSNKVPESGSVFEVVYEHVDKLSETMELENVYELEQTAIVSCNIVNRPIEETEVLV